MKKIPFPFSSFPLVALLPVIIITIGGLLLWGMPVNNTDSDMAADLTATITPASGPNSGSFTLTCDAGEEGGTLPAEYTGDGAGYSPPLSWSNVPEGTEEFALMMTTIPVDGKTKWNWVLYGIPGNTTCLVKNSSGIGITGVGSHGSTMAYEPPNSQGPGPKLYTFTLYALSAPPKLPSADQVTGEVLSKAISSITLGSVSLNLSYTRSADNESVSRSSMPLYMEVASGGFG